MAVRAVPAGGASDMDIQHPELLPDATMDRADMLAVQASVRERAIFDDGFESPGSNGTVVGADLAFDDDEAVAAAVAMRDDEQIDEAVVRRPISIPYIPGLLAFREAGPMIRAIAALDVSWDVLLCDGNGRIHPRQAGLATHIGVTIDRPTIGVAKSLLCGELVDPPPEPYPEGTTIPIVADDDAETVIGYAVQTRQWDREDRSINPVYVSPGHRMSAEQATDLVMSCTAGYKLPEPIRKADQLASRAARER